jgi:quinol monooxygenase YgiN
MRLGRSNNAAVFRGFDQADGAGAANAHAALQHGDRSAAPYQFDGFFQQRIAAFAAWKKVFDSHQDLRTSSGEISTQIFHDASDPNKLTVINKWDSLANAQKFAHSPELKAAMATAGVVGKPDISFLNEV